MSDYTGHSENNTKENWGSVSSSSSRVKSATYASSKLVGKKHDSTVWIA